MAKKPVGFILSVLVLVSMACNLLAPKSATPASKPGSPTQAEQEQNGQTINPTPAPTWQPSLAKLKSEQLKPSSDSQMLQADQGVAVIIPAGVLDKPQEVSLSQVKGNIPKGFSGLKTLAIFDITVGDQQAFTQPLTIEYTYDPAALDSTRPAQDQIFAQVWEATSQTWTLLDVTVDAARHVASVQTDHLCPVSFNTLETGEVWTDTPHFFIYYWPQDVTTYAGPYKRKSTGPCTHPDFVCDVGDLLETAYANYKLKDYPFPDKKIYVFIRNIDDSETKPLSKAIRITLTAWRDYDVLRSAVAHELFHVSQLTRLGISTCSTRKWWMEATADYAGDRVAYAPDRTNQMGVDIKPRYLSTSLDSTLQFHDYSTAHFIDFLVNNENVSNFDFIWSSSAEYKSDNMLLFLDEFLKKRTGTGLDDHYMKFALFYLFDPASPIRKLNANIDQVAISADTYIGKPQSKVVSLPMGKYSADLFRLDSDADRFLKIMPWDPDNENRTQIYDFYGDDPLTMDTPPTPLFDLLPSVNPAVIYVSAGEPLYILVFHAQIIDRGDIGYAVESSDIEPYRLSLHFDDPQSECSQQAASGLGNMFVYLDVKKGTVKVTYHSDGDDPFWSADAEHTVTIDGTGKVKGMAMDGSFSGTDSLINGERGSMQIDATFNFTTTADNPIAWNGKVNGSVEIKMPAHDSFKGLECTATIGTKQETLYPANKQP